MTNTLASLHRLVLRSLAVFAIPACVLPAPSSAQSPRVSLATLTPQAFSSVVDAGPAPSSQPMSLTLTLAPTAARTAALDSYLADLGKPSSPSYHQWLTPAQFAASYGATPDQLSAATAWAQSQGLSVDAVSPSGTRISVSGTAATVQAAFATSEHLYTLNGSVFFANATQPSLTPDAAALFSAIEGLDNLPRDLSQTLKPRLTKVNGATGSLSPADLATLVDANATPILAIDATFATRAYSASDLAGYSSVFRQAAAQGITVLVTRVAAGFFPMGFPEMTAVAQPGDTALPEAPFATRPSWQSAPGLPADALRYAPDLTASSLSALAQTLTNIAAGGRLGNVAGTLYTLAPTPGLFTQPDSATAGTWERASGLGAVDLHSLEKVYPRGVGMSYTSFSATNYSPTHGQGTAFTSNVTSGTGGATPTGTVSFMTSAGANLGTVALVGGSATLSINTLDGGNYVIDAVYSGDATYAPSQSPNSQIYIAPEPSQLTAAISGNPTVGGSYTVVVTDTATYGAPTGPVTLTVQGPGSVYTQTLAPASATSASAAFNIPATTAGTLTLSITCTSSLNYACNNPLTTTVTIQKATPVLSISYTPNPPVSGAQISLNAVVSAVGTAPAPTGNVRFFDNGTTLNAGALSGGSTSTTGTVPTTGTHNITATYDGDANYNSVSTTAGGSTSGTISTTTSLTASATQVTQGANITFTATIVPSSTGPVTPTGTVQFLDGSNPIGTANVSGNTATLTVNTLNATTSHTITAIYSGDGAYTTSTSSPIILAAGPNSTTTTVSLVASSSAPIHGSNVMFTATVAPPSGGTIPTGTVTFTSAQGGTLGQASVVNGMATYTTNSLPGGVSSIAATYNGSTVYGAAASAPLSVNVQPEPVTLTITLPANATFGTAFPVNVAVVGASGIAYPTGTVTITPTGAGYSGSVSGSVTSGGLNSSGSALITLPAQAGGSVLLTATYSGDKNFAAAGPTTTTITVARTNTGLTLSYAPNPPVSGQPTILTAKLTFASSVGPSGTVQFLDGTTVLGTGQVDATGTATYTATLSPGPHTLQAYYLGDLNYFSTYSAASNTSTGAIASTTALTITPTTIIAGQSITFSAVVGPTVNGLSPTGTIDFVAGGNLLRGCSILGGSASCSIVRSLPGSVPIIAYYLGDTNFAPSQSAPVVVTTTTGAGTLTASLSPTTAAPGTTSTVTATVAAPTGIIPTGAVTATITTTAGTLVNTFTTQLPGTGSANTATVSIPVTVPSTAGTYNVIVDCSNTNFTCVAQNLILTSSTANVTGVATLSVAVTPATAAPSSTATVTGTITATAGTPVSGTVTATITPTNAAAPATIYTLPATTGSTGQFQFLIPVPSTIGSYTVTLTCTSASYICAPVTTPLTVSTAVLIATKTVLTSAASTVTTGATVLTATVTPASLGAATATGTVAFYDGASLLGSAPISTTGVATLTVALTTATHSLTAIYSGDTLYATSTSAAITGTGTATATAAAITLTSNVTSGLAGLNVVLTAQVTGMTATGTAPTGTVSFFTTGTTPHLIGTAALGSAGAGVSVAVLTTTNFPAGTQTVYAVYNGDTNFTTVTSNQIVIGLSDYSLIFTPPTQTLTQGAVGFTTATVAVNGAFSGTIALGCTPAPNTSITCAFSPAVLTGSGTSILTIKTTAPRTAANHPPTLRNTLLGGVSFAALLCLLIPGRTRRRIPALFVLLLSLGLVTNLGCSDGNFNSPITSAAGTPLGTTILTISTAGSDGTNTVRHTYFYQVTIQ